MTNPEHSNQPESRFSRDQLEPFWMLQRSIQHYLNNDLAPVIGFGELLRESSKIQPDDQEVLDALLDATRSLARRVRSLSIFDPNTLPTRQIQSQEYFDISEQS